jgi:hypothetical protein
MGGGVSLARARGMDDYEDVDYRWLCAAMLKLYHIDHFGHEATAAFCPLKFISSD